MNGAVSATPIMLFSNSDTAVRVERTRGSFCCFTILSSPGEDRYWYLDFFQLSEISAPTTPKCGSELLSPPLVKENAPR